MIFPPTELVDQAWQRISCGMYTGALSVTTAKVSPLTSEQNHVICVYTDDFTDRDDVMKVRQQLRLLGWTQQLQYKADTYTHLGIYSNNDYNIPPCIYRE
jgi:hypothetical protein